MQIFFITSLKNIIKQLHAQTDEKKTFAVLLPTCTLILRQQIIIDKIFSKFRGLQPKV